MKRKDLKPGQLFKYADETNIYWVPKDGESPPDAAKVSVDPDLDAEVIFLWQPNATSTPPNLIDPNHYKNRTPEPIDVTEGWDLNANLASVIWYIARAGHKSYTGDVRSDTKTDLLKARRFLSREIARLEGRRSWD